MRRDRYKTVTDALAILTDSKDEKGRRCISFFRGGEWGWTAVQPITSEDIEGPGRLQEIFRREELPLVVGAAEMRRAIRKRDEAAFLQAFEKVRPWWPVAGRFTLGPIRDNWAAAQEVYARLLTNLTQNARLIVWQPESGLLMPALYCRDLKTAKFVMLVMGRLRVCPKCKGIFVPKKDNQDYCKVAHGVAWRTAESRRRKKQRLEEAQKKRSERLSRKKSRKTH